MPSNNGTVEKNLIQMLLEGCKNSEFNVQNFINENIFDKMFGFDQSLIRSGELTSSIAIKSHGFEDFKKSFIKPFKADESVKKLLEEKYEENISSSFKATKNILKRKTARTEAKEELKDNFGAFINEAFLNSPYKEIIVYPENKNNISKIKRINIETRSDIIPAIVALATHMVITAYQSKAALITNTDTLHDISKEIHDSERIFGSIISALCEKFPRIVKKFEEEYFIEEKNKQTGEVSFVADVVKFRNKVKEFAKQIHNEKQDEFETLFNNYTSAISTKQQFTAVDKNENPLNPKYYVAGEPNYLLKNAETLENKSLFEALEDLGKVNTRKEILDNLKNSNLKTIMSKIDFGSTTGEKLIGIYALLFLIQDKLPENYVIHTRDNKDYEQPIQAIITLAFGDLIVDLKLAESKQMMESVADLKEYLKGLVNEADEKTLLIINKALDFIGENTKIDRYVKKGIKLAIDVLNQEKQQEAANQQTELQQLALEGETQQHVEEIPQQEETQVVEEVAADVVGNNTRTQNNSSETYEEVVETVEEIVEETIVEEKQAKPRKSKKDKTTEEKCRTYLKNLSDRLSKKLGTVSDEKDEKNLGEVAINNRVNTMNAIKELNAKIDKRITKIIDFVGETDTNKVKEDISKMEDPSDPQVTCPMKETLLIIVNDIKSLIKSTGKLVANKDKLKEIIASATDEYINNLNKQHVEQILAQEQLKREIYAQAMKDFEKEKELNNSNKDNTAETIIDGENQQKDSKPSNKKSSTTKKNLGATAGTKKKANEKAPETKAEKVEKSAVKKAEKPANKKAPAKKAENEAATPEASAKKVVKKTTTTTKKVVKKTSNTNGETVQEVKVEPAQTETVVEIENPDENNQQQ